MSLGQAAHLGTAGSGWEARVSDSRPPYPSTSAQCCLPPSSSRPWFSIQSCLKPVLNFFLSTRRQASEQGPNLALLLCLQKRHLRWDTLNPCSTDAKCLRRQHRATWDSPGLRTLRGSLCLFNKLCDLKAIHVTGPS